LDKTCTNSTKELGEEKDARSRIQALYEAEVSIAFPVEAIERLRAYLDLDFLAVEPKLLSGLYPDPLTLDALADELARAALQPSPRWRPEEPPLKPAPPDRESKQARAARRQARLAPLLEKEGVTINELESSAGLAKNTARKYWDGSTARPRPSTRKKLAEALKVKPEKLPD
jgi:hypothetical protein